MANHSSLPRTVLVLTLKAPCVGKPLSPRHLEKLVTFADHQFWLGIGINVCVGIFCFMMCSNMEKNR